MLLFTKRVNLILNVKHSTSEPIFTQAIYSYVTKVGITITKTSRHSYNKSFKRSIV